MTSGTSPRTSASADTLRRRVTAALAGREGTVSVGVYDRTTDTTCTLHADTAYDSASVVKTTLLAALLWDAAQGGRRLTDHDAALAGAMITTSDNDATSRLWKQLGVTRIGDFLAAAGMTRTTPGANGYWGLTQTTVTDELRLLQLITAPNGVLGDDSRTRILGLMGQVVPAQRWGTPYGAPAGVRVGVKNGWLPRSTHGWRVHSTGIFQGAGHDYMITVLTQGNSTMDHGVSTIQRVAGAVHRDLGRAGP